MELIEQTKEYSNNKEIILKDLIAQLPKIIGDTERTPVLVGVTRLENELEKYITSFLIESPSGKEDLFETGPLSTLSAKISIARRLGLINNELQNAINNMRKIRNTVNKSSAKELYENEKISSVVNKMYDKYRKDRNYEEIEKAIAVSEQFVLVKQKNKTKAKFIMILSYLVYTLQTGKLFAQKKQYKAKLILSFP